MLRSARRDEAVESYRLSVCACNTLLGPPVVTRVKVDKMARSGRPTRIATVRPSDSIRGDVPHRPSLGRIGPTKETVRHASRCNSGAIEDGNLAEAAAPRAGIPRVADPI